MGSGGVMTFIVTGCAGFIGSHLTERLLKDGHVVIGIDNFSTGTRENVELLSEYEAFELYEGSTSDGMWLSNIIGNHNIDAIFHQAALGSVPRSIDKPRDTFNANVIGFQNVLELCNRFGIKKVVYASSSSVYGPYQGRNEDMKLIPLSPYAASKVMNEAQAEAWAASYGIGIIGLRYFNVYGPRQNPNGPYAAVIPRWIDAMKNGGAIAIQGDGNQSRNFTYVKDVVEANLLALNKCENGKHDVFNISGPRDVKLKDVFLELCANGFCQKPIQLEFLPKRKGDVDIARNDSNKAELILQYVPKYSLQDGLREMKCELQSLEPELSAEA